MNTDYMPKTYRHDFFENRRAHLLSRPNLQLEPAMWNFDSMKLVARHVALILGLITGGLFACPSAVAQSAPGTITVVNVDTYSGETQGTIRATSWNPATNEWTIEITIDVADGVYTVEGGVYTGTHVADDSQGATWGSFLGARLGTPGIGAFPPGTHAGFAVDNRGNGQVVAQFTVPPAPSSYPTIDQTRLPTDADPVQLATGSEVRHKRLFSFKGVRNWNFELTYNSMLTFVQSASIPMTAGWGHNFQAAIVISGSNLVVNWDQGRENTFAPVSGSSGHFACAEDGARYDTIVTQTGGGWLLTHRDQSSLSFNSSGQLLSDSDSHGRKLNLAYSSGQLSSITDPVSNSSLALAYNSNGFLQTLTDGTGAVVSLSYQTQNAAPVLTEITDQNGKNWTYAYDLANELTAVADNAGGQIISNTNNASGQVASQVDGRTNSSAFAYTVVSGVPTTTFTDRNGHSETYTFDSNYNELTRTDALSELTQYTYDSSNRITKVTDPLGRATSYSFDAEGNLLSVTDPASKVTSYTYDAFNNLLTKTDPLAHVTTCTYDAKNNLLTIVDALGGTANTTTWTYNANSQPLTKTLPNGGVYQYSYNSLGELIQMTDPNGIVTTYGFDADGRMLYSQDALGNQTSYTYDPVGNLLTVTNPLTQVYTYAYDYRNRVTSITDPTGAVASYTFDNNNNLFTTTVSPASGTNYVTTYAYTPEDQLFTLTDALSRVTRFAYDNVDRLLSITDPAGEATTSAYDAAGQLISVTDALGKATAFGYELRGLLQNSTDPLLRVTAFTYDDQGRRITSLDPLSRQTNYTYDALDRLTQITDPGSLVTARSLDNDGNVASLTNPATHATTFAYDLGDRQTTSTTAAGHSTTDAYDSRGLPHSATLPSGHATTYGYDNAERINSIADPVGTNTITRDANGRVLTVSGAGGTVTRIYDLLGRLTSYTDSAGKLIGFQYDAIGRLSVLTYPGGNQVSYAYDMAGRLRTVTDWTSRVTTYSYDSDGRMTQVLRANGTKQTRSYDNAGQLQLVTDYEPDGITVIYSASYGYDLAGQLTSALVNPPTTGALSNLSQTVDQDDRLLTVNGTSVSTDVDGNLLSIASGVTPASYSYDARNRLIAAGGLTYAYNCENRRISMSNSSGTTQFTINPNAVLDQVLIATAASGTQTFYVYGLGLIYEDTGGTARYYHFDQRGDTVALSGATGAVTATVTYGAYGEILNQTGTTNTPFLFNGLWGVQTDSNGLYFHRARYYHPALKRWLNRDPLGEKGGLNLYAYAANNPISFIDPLGLKIDLSGLSDDTRASTITAYKYLIQDPGAQAIFQQLGQSSTTYRIVQGATDVDRYVPETHTIIWDPTSGEITMAGGAQSAALQFLHEAAHAAGDDCDHKAFDKRVHTPNDAYTNLEEKRVIEGPEAAAARTLGEAVRTEHKDLMQWPVGSPTELPQGYTP